MTASSMRFGPMLAASGSMSTNTGFALSRRMQLLDTMKLEGGCGDLVPGAEGAGGQAGGDRQRCCQQRQHAFCRRVRHSGLVLLGYPARKR